MSKIYNILLNVGKRLDKGLVGRTVDKINTDPEAGWMFLTTVLLLGGFGIVLCILWFYFQIKSGLPVGWIIFDTAILIFCGWAIVKGIIPMSKEVFKQIEEKKKDKTGE